MTKRIQKAIDILLDAYNKDELTAGDCSACAVGNLVAAGLDKHSVKRREHTMWSLLFSTNLNLISIYFFKQNIFESKLNDERVQKCIKATDFTWKELAKIEYTFESTYNNYYYKGIKDEKGSQLKALEEVVKVMMSFDEVKENVKEVFTSKTKVFV